MCARAQYLGAGAGARARFFLIARMCGRVALARSGAGGGACVCLRAGVLVRSLACSRAYARTQRARAGSRAGVSARAGVLARTRYAPQAKKSPAGCEACGALLRAHAGTRALFCFFAVALHALPAGLQNIPLQALPGGLCCGSDRRSLRFQRANCNRIAFCIVIIVVSSFCC